VPLVSVVLAVHNGRPYLSQAVDSVLAQTLAEFELVVVDDASTDDTWEQLQGYAARDRRIVLLRNEVNIGQTRSLNRGLDAARGRYVARMDADDVALPQRLAAQVAFLDRHPDVGLLGTACRLIDDVGRSWGRFRQPETDLEIRWSMMLENPFTHPTVMLRSDLLAREGLRYDASFRVSQDYDLWSRVLRHTDAANLPAALVKYRLHDRSMTHTQAAVMREDFGRVALRVIRAELPGCAITPEDVERLVGLTLRQPDGVLGTPAQLALVATLLDMLDAFLRAHAGAPERRAVQRQATVQIARLLLGAPIGRELLRLIGRLLRQDVALPLAVLAHVRRVGYRRINRRLLAGLG
jgi:hypothetical protein